MKVRHGWLLETHGTGPNVGAAASEVAAAVTGGRELDMPHTHDMQKLFNVICDVCTFIAFSCTHSAALIMTARNQLGLAE